MKNAKRISEFWTGKKLVEKADSSLSPGLEVVRMGGRLMLNSANTNYSFGGLHRVFRKAFKKLEIDKKPPRTVLILGFGAGSVASILRSEMKLECRITGVEKDPEVIRLAREWFSLEDYTGLELIREDAAAYVAASEKSFDLVVVDVYRDFEVPESCESLTFVNDAVGQLNPGGMLVFNKLVYNHEAAQQASALLKKFESLPGKVRMIRIREGMVNRMIVFEKSE